MHPTENRPETIRQENIEIFQTMISHLGSRDYDGCAAYLADDIYADWPYRPLPGLPDHVSGRENLIKFFRGDVEGAGENEGMDDFTPYSYVIDNLLELLDPNTLVAEYHSNSTHIPTNKPYQNRYISILKFADGKVVYWREYVNPAIIYEIFDLIKLPESN